MRRTKIISKILFYISRALALGYLLMIIYAVICLLTGWNVRPTAGRAAFVDILFPFTSSPFLIIDTAPTYIIFSFLLPLVLYSLFFWLASEVFKVFHQPRLFSSQNVIHLRRFYIFNVFIPGAAALLSRPFTEIGKDVWLLVIVHFFLGIFIYFLAAIFTQGLQLQKEQDLFI
ncbi:hypothetical protein SAMN04488128_102538 [Chitinophaga eiseniae]|uniref:DUF2975 domain-containing protein n=1 Tax=Chitinophaga eiseniae TaxID=634771 RepID=A0A1T4QR81_9BACT|nr:DUF2975 domain-containing protein [Chitinophaga eiseniae]SKA06176.1 hypothetical protein SAMN04488128_102538 [Chitinophaga eiseniae]